MPPAARMTDLHVCPMVTVLVPHVGGPILPPCCPTVLIGFLPAARVTDMAFCVGPPDVIVKGSPTVLISSLPAARIGDQTAHGGLIVLGCFTVMIGDAGTPGTPGVTPLLGQQTPMSCGMATTRMVIATVQGITVPEDALQNESQGFEGAYDPVNGTQMSNLTDLLHLNGVKNASDPKQQSIDDLQKATAGGHPAIVHFNNPGGGGHFMVVDGVTTNRDGSQSLDVRDPWPPAGADGKGGGNDTEMSDKEFKDRGYSGWAVTTNP
jgi:uncharacterized Zn-binding protein involved in type VI secretion